jgi:hypothetical protein
VSYIYSVDNSSKAFGKEKSREMLKVSSLC